MLNFSGSTKRRNVNLGSSKKINKSELIEKARLERERRAQEKRIQESTLCIQRCARRWTARRRVLGSLDGVAAREYGTQILVAFGAGILHYARGDAVAAVVEACSVDSATAYWRCTELLEQVARGGETGLVRQLLDKLNAAGARPLTDAGAAPGGRLQRIERLVGARLRVLEAMRGELTRRDMNALLAVVPSGGEMRGDEAVQWAALYGVEQARVRVRANLLCYLRELAQRLSPEVVLQQGPCSVDTIYYLTYLFAERLGRDPDAIYAVLCACIDQHKSFEFDSGSFFFQYVEGIYSYRTASLLAGYLRTHSVPTASQYAKVFLDRAPSPRQAEVLLLGIVADADAMQRLVQECKTSGAVTSASFSLLTECLDIYLSYVNDTVLLGPKSNFPLEDLVVFCNLVRDAISQALRAEHDYEVNKMRRALSLLQKLYIRDRRTNFLSAAKGDDFWVIADTTVKNCDITSLLLYFDEFYREQLDLFLAQGRARHEVPSGDLVAWENDIKVKFFSEKSSKHASWGSLALRKFELVLRAPFLLPFRERVAYFETLIHHDRRRLQGRHTGPALRLPDLYFPSSRRQRAIISRNNILEDAYEAYNPLGEDFKDQLAVTFINEFGPEAGIDGGGITKEFLTSVSDEGFNKDKYRLFKANSVYELYPSDAATSPQQLQYLHFLGKVLGKCLYEKVLIDVHFADFFLHKLLSTSKNMACSFDNLPSFDRELYDNLNKLFDMSTAELQLLDLRMEIVDENTMKIVELVPGGSQIPVTTTNVRQYALAVASYRMNSQLARATFYFQTGMAVIIPPHWIAIFSSSELSKLISGGGRDIDLADLRANVTYGGYVESDPTIQHLWQLLLEFTPEQRCKFIKFATSVPRAPLLGFQMLNPKFGIRNAGTDYNRLPTASTCVNLLKLPDYQDKDLLREKLLYAINSEARFDLS
ncbi:ADL280Wp [Eremothecium gossypii ATCC 10895]|uniref:HECT-type E3 ubiquitin transferase n=1 Tax=Eremothecium gossypii (strain ATCC 10895 / CBS 109.51 / FGSC 9923 / NRRL Y-1056) TaxID=284811 RepID=Q75BG8_EREGS|nr:ADL280Wp [Eremothecium gossypii ATCC 10895]AAS51640.1 ADL280Wp [Eremothecium gossypii ATCC 10895]AEY95936.1 FADL280Wp [Eremothecium gossypii FDAG1]